MEAFSETTQKTYPSWDDLVAAETNGYCVVIDSSRPGTHPAVYGPFSDKETARLARARLRRQAVRHEAPYVVRSYVSLLWKVL